MMPNTTLIEMPEVPIPDFSESFLLWEKHKSIVEHIVMRSRFIQEHERSDYMQEIFINYSLSFHNWTDKWLHICSFPQWFYKVVKNSALRHWVKEKKVSTRMVEGKTQYRRRVRMMATENFNFYNSSEEDYNEDHLLAMDRLISDLNEREKEVVHVFLSDRNLNEASVLSGKTSTHYYTRFRLLKERLLSEKDKYFPGLRIPAASRVRVETNSRGKRARSVIQLDESLSVVKVWNSLSEAGRIGGFNIDVICAVASGQRNTHKGFYWLYQDQNNEAAIQKIKSKIKKPVRQLTSSGELIKEYKSLRHVVNSGYSEGPVKACVEGRKEVYLGFRWEYQEIRSSKIALPSVN